MTLFYYVAHKRGVLKRSCSFVRYKITQKVWELLLNKRIIAKERLLREHIESTMQSTNVIIRHFFQPAPTASHQQPLPHKKNLDGAKFVGNDLFLIVSENQSASAWQSLGHHRQGLRFPLAGNFITEEVADLKGKLVFRNVEIHHIIIIVEDRLSLAIQIMSITMEKMFSTILVN